MIVSYINENHEKHFFLASACAVSEQSQASRRNVMNGNRSGTSNGLSELPKMCNTLPMGMNLRLAEILNIN